MVAKLPPHSVFIFVRGIPSHGGGEWLGEGGCQKIRQRCWWKKRGETSWDTWMKSCIKHRDFLFSNWGRISSINSSKGKESLDSTHWIWQYNSHVSDDEEYRESNAKYYGYDRVYPHHRFLKISVMSQLLDKKYTPKQISSSFSNLHHMLT